jgi:hypothetical protein
MNLNSATNTQLGTLLLRYPVTTPSYVKVDRTYVPSRTKFVTLHQEKNCTKEDAQKFAEEFCDLNPEFSRSALGVTWQPYKEFISVE